MKIYKSLEFFEKLKINPIKISDIEIASQHIKEEKEYDAFCKALNIDKNENSLKLKKYYDEDCNDLFDGVLNHNILCVSKFEIAMMLCIMLMLDDKPITEITNLGYKRYTGKYNPYDFSWFEETDIGGDPLNIIQQCWISNSNFREKMKTFYRLVLDCCDGKTSIDNVFYFDEKIFHIK